MKPEKYDNHIETLRIFVRFSDSLCPISCDFWQNELGFTVK